MLRKFCYALLAGYLGLGANAFIRAEDKPRLRDSFPKPESKGGWESVVPVNGAPDANARASMKFLGVDPDKLKEAWDYNAKSEGATGLIVIHKGVIIGEWYKDCDRNKTFNIFSSSKAYTSMGFGLLLADSEAGKLPGGKKLTLDTKVFNADWMPEALPLSDPRKADITLRQLLNMASGIGPDNLPTASEPFEIALGKTEKSPFAQLKANPGEKFFYSNAGVANLVVLFHHITGKDLFPVLKERVLDPIGMEKVSWTQIGGKGKLGPLSQGYSGIMTTPREHARFCYLSLHKGNWAGQQLLPESYFDFAWASTKTNPTYGGQWWVYPRFKDAPKDLVQTAGAFNNSGYVVPSLDLVFVRLSDPKNFPEKDFEQNLVKKVMAAFAP